MLLNLGIMLAFTLSLTGCAVKSVHPPVPLDGTDFYDGKNKGDECFSKMYLDDYIQWKHDNCLK